MTDRGSQGLARAVFALLVIATAAAFFVTQRLKHAPTVVQQVGVYPFLSPLSINHHLSAKLSFRIKRADDVTVTIVDRSGEDVATLARDHPLAPYTQWSLRWRGRTDAGRIAPDGVYRIRVRLRREGRSALLAKTITLDTVPPHPLITAITAAAAPAAGGGGPAILPVGGGGPLTIAFDTGGGIKPALSVYRTDVAPARLVTTVPVAPGGTSAAWNGTVAGRGVAPGTYLVAISATDRPGNLGQTPALPPRPQAGAVVPGHAGITVRYLGVQPPVVPAGQNAPLVFGVDARRAGYAWSVTRVGAANPRKKSTTARAILRMRPPGGISGVYVLAVHTDTHRTAVPFAVQGPGRQPVLVVLPAITWLGEDPLDDDGDGLPNTLSAGDTVRTDRIFAGAGLPTGFATQVAPLLAYLDRHHLRYDVTTDLALARGQGPVLRGHAGVLLPGDERWAPGSLDAALRAFVRGGGKVAAFGVDSLRRTVTVAGGLLRDPSPPTAADAFGARLAAVAPAPGPITNYSDRIGLFAGAGGQFSGYQSFEATNSVGADATLLASAVTADGRPVIVASRYGRGLVIRTGLPGLAGRLAGDATADALVDRIWALISR
jgi:hypothetical protein